MENSKSIEQVIESMARPIDISDAVKKSIESVARPIGISDELRKSIESVAGPIGIGDELRKTIENLARPIGIGDELRKTIENLARPIGISDELRRSLEHTALLARNVDQSLSNMHISAPTATAGWSHEGFEVPTFPELPPNPIWQTNSHLSELTGTVTQLVDVARQQAELSQAIRTSADLALKYAIQSGQEAKAATLLARKGVRLTSFAITVAIIVALVNISVSYQLSKSTDVRLKEEIRLLADISHKLQQLNGRPVSNAVIIPKAQTEPNKGSQNSKRPVKGDAAHR